MMATVKFNVLPPNGRHGVRKALNENGFAERGYVPDNGEVFIGE